MERTNEFTLPDQRQKKSGKIHFFIDMWRYLVLRYVTGSEQQMVGWMPGQETDWKARPEGCAAHHGE